jgi:DNA-binding response OmpR family regulator
MKVLVIEDEKDIRDALLAYLSENQIEAVGYENGSDILARVDQFTPDLILLDHLMPGKLGADIIREVRSAAKFCEVPIIMLTGLDGENDKLTAFEAGADDYVTKPFSMKEILARIQALVRRSSMSHKSQQNNIILGELAVDFLAHKVTLAGSDIPLTLTEFKILAELLKQSGQVLTRDRLREKALGNMNVTDRTIDVHMASLRKKLDLMGEHIETVRGVGYRMAM